MEPFLKFQSMPISGGMKYRCAELLWNITLASSLKNVVYVEEDLDTLLCTVQREAEV